MDKMSLGNRMKEYYESPFKIKLPMRMPVIVRLDGRAFHTLTQFMVKPFDSGFAIKMNSTAKYLCENIQGAVLSYVQSDEISILLHNYKRLNSQAWFGNELQKIVSISAGLASSYFSINHHAEETETGFIQKPVQFDSRVFVLPEAEVCNYFIWRQQDWERNSIQMLAQSLYSSQQLHLKKNSDMKEMCFKKGKNWDYLETSLKRGRCIIKTPDLFSWKIDNEIPIFSQKREYIEKELKIIED
ncbi:MAG: hypothetical protein GY853_01340 [PVC group bacterium]|nr:hypothetical protein [PVC group bacterium]